MKNSTRTHRRLLRIALGLLAGAIAAPAAQATQVRGVPHEPTTSAIVGGTESTGSPLQDWQLRYGTGLESGGHSPGGPAYGVPARQGPGDAIHAEIAARAGLINEGVAGISGRGTSPRAELENLAQIPSTVPIQAAGPDGFDWVDAGIGASFVLGLALFLIGTMVAARRRSGLAGA